MYRGKLENQLTSNFCGRLGAWSEVSEEATRGAIFYFQSARLKFSSKLLKLPLERVKGISKRAQIPEHGNVGAVAVRIKKCRNEIATVVFEKGKEA